VHVCLDFDYATRAAYKHVKTVFRDPTEEEQKAFDDVAAERGRIEGEINEAQDDDERIAALERRATELEQQEDALNAKLSVPDREQQALAGAVVTIGHDGKVQIERDLLRPEDASRFAQAVRGQRRATTTGGPRVHSAALVRRLTAQRTLALQATLAERPDRGGLGFSGRGVSGNLPVQYSNRRTEIHEETKTKPLSVVQGTSGPGGDPG